jgi:hypothetical protein
MTKKPKLSKVERLLKQARLYPSPTCHDPKQIDLFDHEKQQAFIKPDESIRAYLADGE